MKHFSKVKIGKNLRKNKLNSTKIHYISVLFKEERIRRKWGARNEEN